MQQSLAHTMQGPTDGLWDLQNILDAEIHMGPVDITKNDEENSKQKSKVGKTFLQWAQSQPRLLMDVPFTGTFHWCSKCMPPQWSTTHSTATHTNYSITSK